MTIDSENCGECDFLLGQYEAMTFSLVRLHNALVKAEGSHDFTSIQTIAADAHEVSLRRRNAFKVYSEHRATVHHVLETQPFDVAKLKL